MPPERDEPTTLAPGAPDVATNGHTNGVATQGPWGGGGGWGGGGMGGQMAAGSVIAPPGGWLRTFESLKVRDFRILWVGMLFSFIGMQMGMIARQWLVYDLTGSTTALGVVGAFSAIPMLLLSIPGGVVADRVRKKNLLLAAQTITGVLAFTIGFLIITGHIQLWHIVAVSIISGGVMTFNMPARQALISELVGPRYLMNAIALNSAGMNLTRIAAPVAAGLLIAGVGMANTYFVYAATYVIVVAFLFMLPNGVQLDGPRQSPIRDALDGIMYLRDNKIILSLMVLATVPAIFAMPYQMMLPVYAKDILKIGPQGMGLMMGATGIGALVGSLIVASMGDFQHKGRVLLGAAVGFGLMIALFANSTFVPVSLVLLALLGMASTAYMAMNQTLVQTRISDEIRGRVMGIYMMSWGLMPLGTLPAGFLGDVIGVPMTLTLGGLIMVGCALLISFLVPELRRLK